MERVWWIQQKKEKVLFQYLFSWGNTTTANTAIEAFKYNEIVLSGSHQCFHARAEGIHKIHNRMYQAVAKKEEI